VTHTYLFSKKGQSDQMAQLKHKDKLEILGLFEQELSTLVRMTKVEKMKLRKRIFNVVVPALAAPSLSPEVFMGTVENKLNRVVIHFLDASEFHNKLAQRVDEILKKRKAAARVDLLPEIDVDWLDE
jgi:hypothetical protein